MALNFKQAEQAIIDVALHIKELPIDARNEEKLTILLRGSVGEGKTACVHSAGNKLNYLVRHEHLADRDPTEIGGWLMPNKETGRMDRMKPNFFPTDEEMKGYDGFLLFLDEAFKISKMGQNTLAQLVNENGIGSHKLPSNTVIVMATNRMTDKTNEISPPSHLKNRLVFLDVDNEVSYYLAYVTARNGDARINAYLGYRPENHSKFHRDADCNANSRTWDRVETVLKIYDKNNDDMFLTNMIIGTLGESVGSDFLAWLPMYQQCPNIDAMINNATTCTIPSDYGILYAVLSAMGYKANEKNIGLICKFLDRLENEKNLTATRELIAFTLKTALTKTPTLRTSQSLRSMVGSQSKLASVLTNLIPK